MLTFRKIHETHNSGEGEIGGSIRRVDHTGDEDMAAYDQLGPKTRAVLRDKMPLQWSSKMTLDMIKRQGAHPIQHDDMIARQLSAAADHAASIMRQRPEMNTQRPTL